MLRLRGRYFIKPQQFPFHLPYTECKADFEILTRVRLTEGAHLICHYGFAFSAQDIQVLFSRILRDRIVSVDLSIVETDKGVRVSDYESTQGQALAEALQHTDCLESLDLSGCYLDDDAIKQICVAIQNNPNSRLRVLGVWNNDFGRDGLDALHNLALSKTDLLIVGLGGVAKSHTDVMTYHWSMRLQESASDDLADKIPVISTMNESRLQSLGHSLLQWSIPLSDVSYASWQDYAGTNMAFSFMHSKGAFTGNAHLFSTQGGELPEYARYYSFLREQSVETGFAVRYGRTMQNLQFCFCILLLGCLFYLFKSTDPLEANDPVDTLRLRYHR